LTVLLFFFTSCSLLPCTAQQYPQPTPEQRAGIDKDNSRHFGDDPENAGPLATDLSPALKTPAIHKAMRKVADWELARSQPYFDRIWTFSVMYTGFLAASDSIGDPRYRDAVREMGKKFNWQLRSHLPNADDQSLAQSFLELYFLDHDPAEIAPTRTELDAVYPLEKDTQGRIPWWWCDALFMAPPVWARMYKATNDGKYLDYLDKHWTETQSLLYDSQEHLFARDAAFLDKRDKNGQKIFWSRGNGWVMGGIVRVLQYMPKNDPRRTKYIQLLRDMAARVKTLQDKDGLWHASLLDPQDYPLPEISGSALFTYALAWGVNESILDRKTYRPVVASAWKGMLGHIYADGRLGCIQQTGAAPAYYRPTASYDYGVGAFLLAGSEVARMAKH
jgi:rhamnogalacturonyl hydrolase YesR